MADIAKIKLGSTDYDVKDVYARTEINNIKSWLSPRKVIIFGDSYLSDNTVGDLSTNVRTELTTFLSGTHISFELHSDGGESFGTTGQNAFIYDVQNYTSAFDADKVTDVLFCGGYNDRIYSQDVIERGIFSTVAAVRAKWPNAKIGILHFGWSSTLASTERDKIVTNSIPAYRNAALYGAGYGTNSEYTMHDYELFITNDYFHPNEGGMTEIAKQIAKYLLTGCCDVHYNWRTLYFANGGDNTGTDYTIEAKLDNDFVTLAINERNIGFTTPFNLSPGAVTRILQLCDITVGKRMFMLGMYDDSPNKAFALPLVGYMQYGSSKFSGLEDIKWYVSGGFLYARSQKIASDGSGWQSFNNLAFFHPTGQSVVIPSLLC